MAITGAYIIVENAQNLKEKKHYKRIMDVNIQFKIRKFLKK